MVNSPIGRAGVPTTSRASKLSAFMTDSTLLADGVATV